ncbi:hypothetical protein M0805_001578 [Coniferiporia weirii]|nr:hypothetical protein M0805_001578 [Coniferiporia weirii]
MAHELSRAPSLDVDKENHPASPSPVTPAKKDIQKKLKKAFWTVADDTKLINCLKFQQDAGNQADNNWKSCVWTYCAQQLNVICSRGAEKSATGCKDHWGMMKANFATIDWLLHRGSGFGWNPTDCIVTAPEGAWKELLASDPKYSWLQTEKYIFFDDMADLCLGRMADGREALDITEDNVIGCGSLETQKTSDSQLSSLFHPMDSSQEEGDSTRGYGEIIPFTQSQNMSPVCRAGGTEGTFRAPPVTPALLSTPARKRAASAVLEETPVPRKRSSRLSGPVALMDVASVLEDLRDTFAKSNESSALALAGPSTPQRLSSAIKAVIRDDEMSQQDCVKLICLFRKDTSVVDSYLAIDDDELHADYVRAELDSM